MYKVLCDDKPIHDLNVNGLVLDSPKLILEDNQINTFDFTIQPNHPMYDFIQKMTSKIKVMRDDDELFNGIIKEEKVGFRKSRVCHCESELSYLKNTTQPQAEYHDMTVRGFLEALLQNHNNFSEEKFEVGMVTVTDPNDSLYRFTNFESTLKCINEKLIKSLGGHLRIRKENGIRYLDYLADTQKTNTQKIEFGKNLIDFTKNFDETNIVTSVIPLGAKIEGQENVQKALEKRVDITEVNDGKNYLINNDTIGTYGFIQKVVTFDDVHVPTILKTKGNKYLKDNQFENLVIEVKALDLHLLNPDMQPIDVLDSVQVVSKPHGLDRFFPVTKREIPLLQPENETFTFGSKVTTSLTQATNDTNISIQDSIDTIVLPYDKQNVLIEAKKNATDLIHNALNGHVVTGPDEVLIMDTADKNTASNVWRWNLNGLAYSNTGYNGQYGLAMTMDGHIVGDRITAGSIKASQIDITYRNKVQEDIKLAETNANKSTDEKLKSYQTTEQAQLDMKTAEDNANNSTNEKLKSYWTASETETKLKTTSDEIIAQVKKDGTGFVDYCHSPNATNQAGLSYSQDGAGWAVSKYSEGAPDNITNTTVYSYDGQAHDVIKVPSSNGLHWKDRRIVKYENSRLDKIKLKFKVLAYKSTQGGHKIQVNFAGKRGVQFNMEHNDDTGSSVNTGKIIQFETELDVPYTDGQVNIITFQPIGYDAYITDVHIIRKLEDHEQANMRVTSDAIKSKVSKNQMSSYVEQYYDRVLFKFNENSNVIQIEEGRVAVYDNAKDDQHKLSELNKSGLNFWRDGSYLGTIGDANVYGNAAYVGHGFTFNLKKPGNFMAWSYDDGNGNNNTFAKMVYWPINPDVDSVNRQDAINFYVPTDMHYHNTYNARLDFETSRFTRLENGEETWVGVGSNRPYEINFSLITGIHSNGQIAQAFPNAKMTIEHGLITGLDLGQSHGWGQTW